MTRLASVGLMAALMACDRAPVADPIAQALAATPAGQVGLYAFLDKVVVVNHTTQSLSNCVVLLDDAARGELGALPAGATVTLMRTRFQPYLEADVFYARGSKASRMECDSPAGRVALAISSQREQTVIVPPKR